MEHRDQIERRALRRSFGETDRTSLLYSMSRSSRFETSAKALQ